MSSLCHLCLGGPGERRVSGYACHVCERCWHEAADGWPKHYESQLFAALSKAGLLIPDRNHRGLLPRRYAPPADYAL